MANIIVMMRKEASKGNTLMSKKGEFVNPEKLENTMRKAYVSGLKNGSVSFNKSFADYQQEQIEKSYLPVSAIEKILSDNEFFDLIEYVDPFEAESIAE